MIHQFFQWLRSGKRKHGHEIAPDEILLDGANLPDFDTYQFEGRLEKPITKRVVLLVGLAFAVVVLIYGGNIWRLQISQGESFSYKSEANRLRHTLVFAERGLISDRNDELLAWNAPSETEDEFNLRRYSPVGGLGNLLGFVKYPSKDSSGFYYREDFIGADGIEDTYNSQLAGSNGRKIIETNALDQVQSESIFKQPRDGESVKLTIDSRLQSALFSFIKSTAREVGFTGGAGVIMDVETGELLTITTYPEYSSQVLTDGKDQKAITEMVSGSGKPSLNRAIHGLYTPGSIVKPVVALGALQEKIIGPTKKILSTGSISIPNQYDPTKKSVFTDWKAHGWVDLREALAVSSNVYFYEVGGGFEDQKGLGISGINNYASLFGLGREIPGDFFSGASGVVPNPVWKAETFSDKVWRVGDTYNTAIGQYGFQVTPLQMVRVMGAVANSGKLLAPRVVFSDVPVEYESIPIDLENFQIVREGIRGAVLQGTTQALNFAEFKIAGKTGTAELGTTKSFVNSWVVGFFPYEKPRYAFAVIMEKGPRANLVGAAYVMRQFFEWLYQNAPEYLRTVD